MNNKKLRLMLVDDQSLFREALRTLLLTPLSRGYHRGLRSYD